MKKKRFFLSLLSVPSLFLFIFYHYSSFNIFPLLQLLSIEKYLFLILLIFLPTLLFFTHIICLLSLFIFLFNISIWFPVRAFFLHNFNIFFSIQKYFYTHFPHYPFPIIFQLFSWGCLLIIFLSFCANIIFFFLSFSFHFLFSSPSSSSISLSSFLSF